MKFKWFLLALILILYLATRLYQISTTPPSLYWDEASIGYNAYSMIITGADEWGKSFPLNFRAFGEFKLPVYIYSVAVSEKLFGINAFAVRFPAVLYSLGTVFLTFLLTLKLSKKKLTAFFATLFLTLSPWFFIFSRVGYEANAGLMFFVLGVYLLTFFEDKKYFIIFSILSFLLSMYSYNSFRVAAPLALIIFGIQASLTNRKRILEFKFSVGLSILLLLIGIMPILHSYLADTGAARFETVSILNETSSKIQLAQIFTKNYFSHFTPNFLFINGDSQTRIALGRWGELFWVELPLLLLGLYSLITKKSPWNFFLLLLVLIAPIPAAITTESPHSLRAVSTIPFLSTVSAYGVEWLLEKIKNVNFKKVSVGIIVGVFLIFFSLYFKDFTQNYNVRYSQDWQYPYEQIFTKYTYLFQDSQRILVSDAFSQPYIYALFYQQYNSLSFRKSVSYNPPNLWGTSLVSSFGNFVFPEERNLGKIEKSGDLVFDVLEEPQNKSKQVGVINLLNGKTAMWIYKL